MEPLNTATQNTHDKPPAVPIKTYRWEDVRRSRLRGGYPWTHLYKNPFDEEIDPQQFRLMETIPKSKSAVTLRKSSDDLNIQELRNGVSHENISEHSGYIVITEVPSESSVDNHSTQALRGSLTIEETTGDEPEILNLESADSSDNISQYLDKDDPIPEEVKPGPSQLQENGHQERAKSEEPKRKRKLSIDSSYSRKSLSKLAFLKKLKESKDKIKIPKLSLPSLKRTGSEKSKKSNEEKPKKETVKQKETPKQEETKKDKSVQRSHKTDKPVYIHIPLKPPEGQTDEFSYLEFEDKKPEEEIKPPTPPPEETPKEQEVEEVKPEPEPPSNREVDPFALAPAPVEQRRFSENPDEIVAIEILKAQSIDLDDAVKNGLDEGGIYIVQPHPDSPHKDDVIMIISEQSEPKLSRTPSRQSSRKARAKSAEPGERKRKLSIDSSYSRRSLSKLGFLKKLRDAKDKIKFPKLSLSRSNSKRDKPPTKKLKEEETAKTEESKEKEEKLEQPKGSNSKKDKPPKPTTKKLKEDELPKKEEKKEKSEHKKDEPKYIHIPLKPPPGQTDEFSYLEFEEKKEEPQKAVLQEESSLESPPIQSDEIQMIFVTPPSDDEILVGPEIPETPSSDGGSVKNFFTQRIEELKVIAKDAVDKASPKSRKKKLATVSEESLGKAENFVEDENEEVAKGEQEDETVEAKPEEIQETRTDQAKTEEVATDNDETKSGQEGNEENKTNDKEEPTPKLEEKIFVDEEDGLKSTEPSKEELKPSLKSEITDSPVLKKKVSFKRRSKDETKDGEYEEIQAPKEEQNSKLNVLGTSQSMSVDEEKSYLDEKIIKSTSLEEDYNRWSKLGDHEYEPINPPPEGVSPLPTVQITDMDQESPQIKPISTASSTTSLERRMLSVELEPEEPLSAEEIQSQIEDKFFNKPQQETTTPQPPASVPAEEPPKTPNKFGQAMKNQAEKFRNKIHSIKKPNFDKFKMEKPKFNFPKIPDTVKISLPRKTTKRILKQRNYSTESNAGDSAGKKYFNFSTYPRLFKKKQQPKSDSSSLSSKNEPEFATVPRTKRTEEERWGDHEPVRVPLRKEESIESIEKTSHIRYDQDIDIDDAFEKENQEIHRASPFSHNYNSRWNHGSFHPENDDFEPDENNFENHFRNQQITDLDDGPTPAETFKDIDSSESSIHRRGVLEEIDSDEFFLRQKGISQDNIEVGMYLSSEIREAFKSPPNALSDLERNNFNFETRASNQSLPETPSKRKQIKKPKRKKTPHVSQEHVEYEQDSETEISELPPSRPKRRSKKKDEPHVIPYQETIPVIDDTVEISDRGISIIGDFRDDFRPTYENELMEGKEQPEIKVTDPYYETKYDSEEEIRPAAPPRKHKSLKSLSYSEHDSILGEFNIDKEIPQQNVEVYKSEHEYIIPTPEEPPTKPPRTLSTSSSKSLNFEETEIPSKPVRSRSREESTGSEPPCVEETCVQDFRDYMGYAVIDKNQKREPPLPPPRTPPRKKKAMPTASDEKFFTVPRQSKDEPPVRPLRNYSTLGPSRPPRRKPPPNLTDEEKESIDLSQYIEIEEEPNRDLHSGEAIQKIQNRPLPAPPRPPRKTRAQQDEEADFTEEPPPQEETTVERHLITPTRYTYEEETITHGSLVVQPLDGAQILPDSEITRTKRSIPITKEYEDDDEETSEIPEDFKKLKDPDVEEPKNPPVSINVLKAQKLQVSDLDVDRLNVNELLASKIIVSEIDSLQANEFGSKSTAVRVGELELPPSLVQQLLEKLQEEQGQKKTPISEQGPPEQINPLEESEGTLPGTGEEIKTPTPPPRLDSTLKTEEFLQEFKEGLAQRLRQLEEQEKQTATTQGESEEVPPSVDLEELGLLISTVEPEEDSERSPEELFTSSAEVEFFQQPPISQADIEDAPLPLTAQTESDTSSLDVVETPRRPPRQKPPESNQSDSPEVEDEPPPRPPQPEYFPSQPPPSFYDLRAQQYIEGDIPTVPRRKRHHKSKPISRSSSEEETPTTGPPSRRRFRSPEPSIPELTGQLIQACGTASNNALKRLITYITNSVLQNADGQQDLHVAIVVLLVLIAGLILLGYGDGKTVHYHHWEYFNPPRDM